MSLVRMNRVLEINRELAYAVVEPGVRWFDLHAALQEAGHDDLLVTIPDLGWGSVVGNSLDNGITYMPYGQDFMAPCGMEVVLADGELRAHRHGRDARQQVLAPLQARPRAGPGPAVHPVQLRDRHAHGLLAHAPARGVRAAVPDGPPRRPARAGDRHPPRAASRRDDPRRAEPVLDAHPRGPVPRDHGRVHRRRRRAGRRADPGDRRPHRPRALGHARRDLGRRAGHRAPRREGRARPGARSTARRSSTSGRSRRTTGTRSPRRRTRSTPASRTSTSWTSSRQRRAPRVLAGRTARRRRRARRRGLHPSSSRSAPA